MLIRKNALYPLSFALAALMLIQAALGLLLPHLYRDVAWIKATWFGNDLVTLFLALPLFILSILLANRGSIRGQLLWLGMLGYAFYNYAYYLFGAALNAFFPIYVASLALSGILLVISIPRIDLAVLTASFRERTPVRMIGGFLTFVGIGLASVWLIMWAAYIFAAKPTPIEPEAFKVVAAIDISFIVTMLGSGGLLLWQRNAWGYVIAPIASVLSALYLIVLSVNSFLAIQRGAAAAPGELPVWGTLAFLTALCTYLLLSNVQKERA
ncbi:MAG: hypothetical protein HPY59_14460 [Anaerolineae bacterium]|nr:hypothetical protein [Anaerolineae bacterium]